MNKTVLMINRILYPHVMKDDLGLALVPEILTQESLGLSPGSKTKCVTRDSSDEDTRTCQYVGQRIRQNQLINDMEIRG